MQNQVSQDIYNAAILKKVLVETLLDFAVKDMKEHGRLLILKERLVKIIGTNEKLDIKTLALF